MTNRREILEIGIAAAALPFAAAAVASAPASRGGNVELYKALYDVRFPASAAFAGRLAARGIAVVPMRGDMTRFWYDDLYHRWRQGPAAIAGLTAHGALFCLEQLAWAEGLRVVFRARHASDERGRVRHSIEGPMPLVGAVEQAVAESCWVAAMADAVTSCPGERLAKTAVEARTPASAVAMGAGEPLYSWVIAPARRG
jgi:hypothetical protein